jgi:hypothetical protein
MDLLKLCYLHVSLTLSFEDEHKKLEVEVLLLVVLRQEEDLDSVPG